MEPSGGRRFLVGDKGEMFSDPGDFRFVGLNGESGFLFEGGVLRKISCKGEELLLIGLSGRDCFLVWGEVLVRLW